MKNLNVYLVILIVFLITCTIGVSYAYFDVQILNYEPNNINITSGIINLNISDVSVKINSIIPVYDNNYKESYNKEFAISNSNSNIDGSVNIYLKFNDLDPLLISEYIKFKLVSSTNEYNGDFSNIKDNQLLLANTNIKANDYDIYNLYIWISYKEDIDQMYLLNKNITSNIYIEGYSNIERGN